MRKNKQKKRRNLPLPIELDSFGIHLKAKIIDFLYALIRDLQGSAKVHLVIGAKWGDEGKGKMCAFFSRNADLAIRATGGTNAGHTVVFYIGGKKIKMVLHLLPAGVAYEHMMGLIGKGVAIDFDTLFEEISKFEELGINVRDRLRISGRAIVLMPYHKDLDVLYEKMRAKQIGTTKKGIGPAYEDFVKRDGLIVNHLFTTVEELEQKIAEVVLKHNVLFREFGMKEQIVDARELAERYHEYGKKIRDIVVDGHAFVRTFAEDPSKTIVVEGAQAVFLSIADGDYPDTTSSDSNTNGTLSGAHLSIADVPEVTLVFKGYDSRVGMGPFPTELDAHIDENGVLIPYVPGEAYTGDLLRDHAGEYGATTGRPRRVGWFDPIALIYAVQTSGARNGCVNHMDTLGKFALKNGGIAICVGYKYQGRIIRHYPTDYVATHEIPEPILRWYDGWEITPEMKTYRDLPANCKKFIMAIEKITRLPIKYIGIGPGDNDIIVRKF